MISVIFVLMAITHQGPAPVGFAPTADACHEAIAQIAQDQDTKGIEFKCFEYDLNGSKS